MFQNLPPPVKITGIYVLAGILWIVSSDKLLSIFTETNEPTFIWQTVKGTMYVFTTGLLLYFFIKNEFRKQQKTLRILNKQDQWSNQVIKNIPETDVLLIDRNHRIIIAQGNYFFKKKNVRLDVVGNVVQNTKLPKELKQIINDIATDVFYEKHSLTEFSYDKLWFSCRSTIIYKTDSIPQEALLVFTDITKDKNYVIALTQEKIKYEKLYNDYLFTNEQLKKKNNDLISARNELSENERKYHALFENINDAIFLHTIENNNLPGQIKEINKAACNSLGYTRGELISKTILDLTPDHLKDRAPRLVKQGVMTENFIFNTKLLAKNGDEIDVEVSSQYFDLNNQKMFLSICRDIRERMAWENALIRQKEKAEESDKLKSAFLTNISHEIRTPMNGILGFAGLLGQNNISETLRQKYLGVIQSSSDQLLRIIDDILDISRIETGQIEIFESNFSASLLLEETAYILQELISTNEKNVEVRVINAIDTVSDKVLGDKDRIQQVLLNLVSNAQKFTSSGTIEMGAKIHEKRLYYWVKDTGTGITPDMQDKIFERFAQDQMVQKQAIGGTGLGLSISKGLIQLMQGEISVESFPGKGSTFTFYIPFKKAKNTAKPDSEPKGTYSFNNKSILVVEDNQSSYYLINEFLGDKNVRIMHAQDSVETFELLEKNPETDLILMDIRLPGVNGCELATAIRKNNKSIPIVAQTAYAGADDRHKCYEAGCNDFISKPLNFNSLLDVLNKYLNKNGYSHG